MNTKKIKKILIDKDLTITGLAKAIGYSRLRTSQIVNGKGSPCPLRTEKAIANILGLTPDELH